MLTILQGRRLTTIDKINEIIKGYETVEVDLGTGSGKFIYRLAKLHRDKFFIGIDSAAERMIESSRKCIRKPTKGGLNNILFLIEAAETLSDLLTGISNRTYINFPWGSLLEGLIKCDDTILQNIIKIACPPKSYLEILFTYSLLYEEQEIIRRGLDILSYEYLSGQWKSNMCQHGIIVTSVQVFSNKNIKNMNSEWAKKLGYGRKRDVFKVLAEIEKQSAVC